MIIASRTLILRNPDTTETAIAVRIFAPEQMEIDWSCHFEVDWPHGRLAHAAIGIDAMQALYLALQMVGAHLYTSEYHEAGQLRWGERGEGYGFPVAHSIRDMLIGDDAKYF